MQMRSFHRAVISVTLAVLCWSTSVLAATVSVTSSGSSSYTLMGSGMDGVSGIQLDITYDAAALETPTVTQGALVAGAMLAANTTRPGSIRIAIISTNAFSASGPIATVSFASRKGNGDIKLVSTNMIDRTGASVSATANNQSNDAAGNTINSSPFSSSPSPTPTSSSQSTTAIQTTAQSGTASNTTYAGTVTLPTDLQQRSESQPVTSPAPVSVPAYPVEQPAKTAEQAAQSGKTAPESKPEETRQLVVYKGIAERFKHYNGSKSLSTLAKLFDKQIAQNVRQEPPVLTSDGKNKATLTVDLPSRITSSTNFAVNGGTLVSYKQEKQIKGRWIVTVQPNSGSNSTSLTIIAGAEEFEYPLTVVQPIKTSLTVDEKGWIKFNKEVGTAAAPLHDFNGDGVRDYLDEYIFVANYLAARKPAATKPAVRKPASK